MKNSLLSILISLNILTLPFLVSAQKKNQTTPSKVVLSWSTPGTAPLFYKGKILPTLNSRVSVKAAVINGDEKNFIFKWFLDDNYNSKVSGQGKNEFNFTAKKAIGDSYNVKIELKDNTKAQKIITQTSVDIRMAEPEIIFYDSRDLTPTPLAFKKEIELSPGQNIEIIAESYFFQDPFRLTYEWFSAGILIKSDAEEKNLLTIAIPREKPVQPVTKHIKLRLTKTSPPFQRQEKELTLKIF